MLKNNEEKSGIEASLDEKPISSKKVKNKIWHISIEDDKRKDRVGVVSNWISGFTTLVAGITFLFTFLLFKETRKATDAAITSSKIAQDALKHQRYIDSIGLISDSIKFQYNSNNERKKFIIDSINTQVQINSLKSSQFQFDVINRPRLKAVNFKVDSITLDRHFKTSFSIENFGKIPAKILSAKSNLRVTSDSSNYDFKEMQISPSIGFYLPPGTLLQLGTDSKPLTKQTLDGVYNGLYYLFLIGEIKYKNTVTQKVNTYRFIYRISLYPYLSIIEIFDED